MNYDDYDIYINEVQSYAEDYTDDKELIEFFKTLAETSTDSITEHAEFGSTNAMEEAQNSFDKIIYLLEEYEKIIDFKEILDIRNNDGSKIWIEDIESEVTEKVNFIITKMKIKECCPNIDNFLINQHDFFLTSLFNYKDFDKYKEEFLDLLTTEDTTDLLLRVKKEIETENFFNNYEKKYNKDSENRLEFTEYEKKYIREMIENRIDNEYSEKINNENYKVGSEFQYDYSMRLIEIFFQYKSNKSLLKQNSKFKLENCKTKDELINDIIIYGFKQKNINNLNEKVKFTNKRVNPFYKHILRIIDKESDEYLKDKLNYGVNYPSNILNAYDLTSISDKVVDTYKTYKIYEELFKNYNSLPKEHPLHFNFLAHDKIEDIDDLAQEIIEKNKTKLYAKRFLGSYMKLMNEDSHKIFEVIRGKDMSPSLIREELSKIALFKNSENLNIALNKIIELDSLSVTKIVCNINDNNLDVEMVEKNKNSLIIIPNDVGSSKALGSNRWYISNSEYHFNNYLQKGDNQRYHVFIYDFEREERDPLSKIAITIDENKKITSSFNNSNVNIKYKIQEIIREDKIKIIEDKVDYLIKNKKNYQTYRELKDNANISHKLIKDKTDDIIDFYTYLINSNKMKDFIDEFINSKKDILRVMEDSVTLNKVNKNKVIEFKKLIEKENESISIDLSKLNSLNIEENLGVKDFLLKRVKKPKSGMKNI